MQSDFSRDSTSSSPGIETSFENLVSQFERSQERRLEIHTILIATLLEWVAWDVLTAS